MKKRRHPWSATRITFAAGAAAAAAAVAYAENGAGAWDSLYWHLLARSTGWCAVGALLLSLTCSPAHRLLRRLPKAQHHPAVTALPRLRRSLGLASAIFAAAHAVVSLLGPLDGALPAVVTWPFLRAGLAALAILGLLFLTSFPRMNRFLRIRAFKALHRVAHGAFLLVVLHLVLGPYAPRTAVVGVAVLYGVLGAVRIVPWLSERAFASSSRTSS
ncbi:MAG: ferric reductase-like transmembrane domain-containing protein [Deltaproteobacteria bacterium]|nr:ferric reductase-like transmembrane domain-containing protein [Deltaproteobacteria bacterium]